MTEEMGSADLRYDRMVEDALRSVVRRALIHVARNGLPGSHHFYITFRTDHDDCELPQALRERYPGEMTIVLQHQFWGLEVDDEQFCVTLSFSDVPHRLVVPFAAVTAFADPSVRFGLQFDVDSAEPAAGAPAADDPAVPAKPAPTQVAGEAAPAAAPAPGKDDKPGDKVVTLDAFRKK